jgi:hypothetical protein
MLATLIRRIIPKRFRPLGYLTHLVRTRTDCRVQRGPFAGMRYVDDSVGSAYVPKLLGIYERELSECVEKIVRRRPSVIIDIGAGEGYYVVGLAIRNPTARLVAFEMEPAGQDAIREMAQLNGVGERVDIRGKCEVADLNRVLDVELKPIVVCDAEGYEAALLNPFDVPALRNVTMLVETHEFVVPGITAILQERFADSHNVQLVWQLPRDRTEFPWRTWGTALLPNSYLDWAVSEWRPERMSWLWMEPKN